MSIDTFWSAVGAVVGFAVGMVGHELAHGHLADRFGDKSARFHGRLAVRSRSHVDGVGTLVLPIVFTLAILVGRPFGILFGYAKPIQVNQHRLRRPQDAIAVALAGPAFNLIVTLLAGAALRASIDQAGGRPLVRVLAAIVFVNAFLFVVNILPIPPLDGSRILARFVSPEAAMKIEDLGQYLLLFLVLFLIFEPLGAILQGLADPICKLASGFPCGVLV